MTIQNRTVTITGVFASNANTTIPASPVAGISYRNTALSSTAVSNGWSFKTIVDSANFNQALYEYSAITKQIETYGFLPWSNLTDYVQGSLCLGSNGTIYQAKQNTGPSSTAKDPTTDSEHTYWDDFVGETYVKKAGTNTITANNTFSGTNTFSGSATFSNSVALGSSATATTQTAGNNSTKVATTAFVTNALKSVPPVGCILAYAGNTVPSGWLICDGSAISRTSYASLFAVIGTTYGAGDGSTTFNLPNGNLPTAGNKNVVTTQNNVLSGAHYYLRWLMSSDGSAPTTTKHLGVIKDTGRTWMSNETMSTGAVGTVFPSNLVAVLTDGTVYKAIIKY